MKNLYYKIIFGFDAEDYIPIEDSELEKAFYAFLKKKDGIYSGGAVKGTNIQAIQPDYHRAMGWNRGWRLTDEDYAELNARGIANPHMNTLADVKMKVSSLIETGQENLIGKNADIKKLN